MTLNKAAAAPSDALPSAIDNLTGLAPGVREELNARAYTLLEDALQTITMKDLEAQYRREVVAAHEAGHAVIHARQGDPLAYAKVMKGRNGLWQGTVMEKDPGWSVGPGTPAEGFISQARICLGGLAGEFVAGYNTLGSSVDEVVVAQYLVRGAAQRLEMDGAKLWKRVFDGTIATVERHADAHKALTRLLCRERYIDETRLAVMLKRVYEAEPAPETP